MINNLMMMRLLMILMVMGSMRKTRAQIAPALFMFGDSLVDVGNNNHLLFSLAKADFPHNGIDFPNHIPTGRFSNGKNAADFLAEKLGLASSPAYLSVVGNKNSNLGLTGVSFASGGAGILDATHQILGQALSMNKQVEYFGTVQGEMVQQLGQEGTDKILSKAIIGIVIGSNDILRYFGSSNSSQLKMGPPQQLVDSMVIAIKSQLKRMYDIGGRKFAIVGIGAVGCCPAQRARFESEACNEAANFWASKYNQGLLSVLQEYKQDLNGFQYSYFDTYNVLLNLILQPSTYGFKDVKSACCGLGNLRAKVACTPLSVYCTNRSDHVFWDFYHPTEVAFSILLDTAFDGPEQYTFPMNIRQLASL